MQAKPNNAAKAQSENTAENEERRSVIQWLIDLLKRIIGYQKGERDEFRYNNITGHPNYEFQNKDGKIKAFGITHSDKTFGRNNMPLDINPEKGKTETSYIRNGIINADEEVLSVVILCDFEIAQNDKAKVKSKKRYHKKESQRQAAKKRKNKKSK